MTTYGDAGVDVAGAERLVAAIAPHVRATWDDGVVGGFGGFAAGVRLPAGYERPVLMLTTDGVGTKAEVARLAGRYDGIGQDLVAMLVDDLVAVGAKPLAVVDQLTVGALQPGRDEAIVASVAAACQLAGCALVGGEIAEHPGTMEPDRFDLAGTALGVVDEGRQVTGEAIAPGDRLIAVASPNLRANGFSLVRHAVLSRMRLSDPLPGTGGTVADVLLEPSVVYAPAIVDLLGTTPVRGLAHVTGGGIAANLRRVLPEGCRAAVDRATWRPPPVFATIAEVGDIGDDDMFATFNMGVGYVVVVPPDGGADAIAALNRHRHEAWEVGAVMAGDRGVHLA